MFTGAKFGFIAALSCVLLVACASGPPSPLGRSAPPAASAPPVGDGPGGGGPSVLDLGDWGRTEAGPTRERFVRSLALAAQPGQTMSATLETMRRNGFGCSPGRGASAPAYVCERQFLQAGCTHTWQALLFGSDRLTEARGGYDRLCRDRSDPGGGLLGAPPS